ncbi:hypothetical protein BDQ17DRAFT_1349107 [Cyathus striatus]|nr:hypothetical protein BDQ17DRAFT_1349107 [Cyathus striatus]
MSSRSRQREDVEKAYEIQVRAGIEGATRMTAVGVGLAIIAHYSWPLFRRQRLPFKAFLVSGFTIAGLVHSAENALLKHEAERRREESIIRREARIDLARQGVICTESEIAKWREAREQSTS